VRQGSVPGRNTLAEKRQFSAGAPAIEPPQQASSYSDTELKSFALTALNVVRIRNV
jgi:hypothetical protein